MSEFKEMSDKIVEEYLLKVFRKCYEISTTTDHDVFFDYYPHINCYEIDVHFGGWRDNRITTHITEPNTHVTLENMEETLEKLKKYEVKNGK
jgi:hypothetical protein